MKKLFFFVFILYSGFVSASGQFPGSTKTQGLLIASKNPAYRKPSKEDLRLVGGATLLWKELRRTGVAKIEMNKK